MLEIAPFLQDPTSQYIIEKQYVMRDETGAPVETAMDVFSRVGYGVAKAEKPEQQEHYGKLFTELHTSGSFCGGGRILAGIGTAHGNALNCFTQAAHENDPDTFEGVMELAMKLALVTKVGGGNGVNLDELGDATAEGIAKVTEPYAKGPHYVAMSISHPNIASFIKGEVKDLTKPGAPLITYALRRLNKVAYTSGAPVSSELLKLASENGVMVVTSLASLPVDLSILVGDAITDIMGTAKRIAKAAKDGISFVADVTDLRPEGSYIVGSGGTSSGPFSFVHEIFDHFVHWALLGGIEAGPIATLRFIYAPILRVIRNGGTRRGAGMATIMVTNPNLLDFITAKDVDREVSEGEIGTFNISVLVTDAFMEMVEADAVVPVKYYPVAGKYESLPVDENGFVKARWLMRQIAQHAWETGEPGVLFVDRINDASAFKNLIDLFPTVYRILRTNPCGEQPLASGESCDLGAQNLANYVEFTDEGIPVFNLSRFKADAKLAIRFLDNVLDVNVFALDDNREVAQNLRRVGLGQMGLADCLILMELRYDSQEARDFIYLVSKEQTLSALEASQELAVERGAFPLMLKYPEQFAHIVARRNVALMTVAPTGTTAMAYATTGGLEPIYSLVIYRKVGSEYIRIVHPLFQEMLEKHLPTETYTKFVQGHDHPEWDWDKLIDDLAKHEGSCQELDLPEAIKAVFVVAHDVSPADHVRMQGVVQRAFDEHSNDGASSLSKTINMPNSATVEEVEDVYRLAFLEGCKGTTVYRDGSRQFQVLSTSQAEETKTEAVGASEGPCPKCEEREAIRNCELQPRIRPERLYGFTDTVETADGKLYVTLNYDDEGPREVVAAIGKGGGVLQSLVEGHGRLISMALQYGVPFSEIIHKLRGIRGGNPYGFGPQQVLSIPDAIGKVLAAAPATYGPSLELKGDQDGDVEIRFFKSDNIIPISEARKVELDPVKDLGKSPECPDCGGKLIYEMGCSSCPRCMTSKCG